MPSSNKTEILKLSQYLDNDIPQYLEDYNADMSKIDAGVKQNMTSITQISQKVNTIDQDVGGNTTEIENVSQDVTDLELRVEDIDAGVKQNMTSITQISQKVNTIDQDVTDLELRVEVIENKEVVTPLASITKIWSGTQAQYDALGPHPSDVLYIIE